MGGKCRSYMLQHQKVKDLHSPDFLECSWVTKGRRLAWLAGCGPGYALPRCWCSRSTRRFHYFQLSEVENQQPGRKCKFFYDPVCPSVVVGWLVG